MDTGAIWGALTAVALGAVAAGAVLEVYALRSRRRGDTYSEWLRPWARRHRGVFLLACGLLGLAGLWLPGHILGG